MNISPARQRDLSLGNTTTTHLGEILSVDFAVLVQTLIPGEPLTAADIAANGKGILHKMRHFGEKLLAFGGEAFVLTLSTHPSDSVRGMSIFGLAKHHANSPLETVLDVVRPFATDAHFGVREWAWLAIRPKLATTLQESIAALSAWTSENDVNLRRFAVESLRPRGVWCTHITELRSTPELGLPLLEPMRAEAEKYAQDSVANWLNDASKDRPEWVRQVCQRWEREVGDNPHTRRIIRRALRSIMKGNSTP